MGAMMVKIGFEIEPPAFQIGVRQNSARPLNLIRVTCYAAPQYGIHFKCVLNFGEGQEFKMEMCAEYSFMTGQLLNRTPEKP